MRHFLCVQGEIALLDSIFLAVEVRHKRLLKLVMAAVATRLECAKHQLRSLDIIGLSCLTDGLSLFDNRPVIGFVLADVGANETHDAHFSINGGWRWSAISGAILSTTGQSFCEMASAMLCMFLSMSCMILRRASGGVSVPSSAQVIAPIIAMSVPIAPMAILFAVRACLYFMGVTG
jgi:hypothetical protein